MDISQVAKRLKESRWFFSTGDHKAILIPHNHDCHQPGQKGYPPCNEYPPGINPHDAKQFSHLENGEMWREHLIANRWGFYKRIQPVRFGSDIYQLTMPYCREADVRADNMGIVHWMLDQLSSHCGMAIVNQSRAQEILLDNPFEGAKTRREVNARFATLMPMTECGAGGRRRYFWLRDLVLLFPPSSRLRCVMCQKRGVTEHHWDFSSRGEFVSYPFKHPRLANPTGEIWLCSRGCSNRAFKEEERWLEREKEKRQRSIQDLRLAKAQMKAIRKYLQTNNLEAFASLPKEFRPVVNSQP